MQALGLPWSHEQQDRHIKAAGLALLNTTQCIILKVVGSKAKLIHCYTELLRLRAAARQAPAWTNTLNCKLVCFSDASSCYLLEWEKEGSAAHMVCRFGKAPVACQVEGIDPASWLLDRSTVVKLVRPVVQLEGKQPVRVLFCTCDTQTLFRRWT